MMIMMIMMSLAVLKQIVNKILRLYLGVTYNAGGHEVRPYDMQIYQ